MIHLVIPIMENLTDAGKAYVDKVISDNVEAVFSGYAPQFYVVKYRGSSFDLSNLLGFGIKPEEVRGVVATISPHTCYGFARSDLWDWIEAHGKE